MNGKQQTGPRHRTLYRLINVHRLPLERQSTIDNRIALNNFDMFGKEM